MKKAPQRPEDIFEPFGDDLKEALGPDLMGVSLYGAAAAGRYTSGKSELNFMVLVTDGAQRVESRLMACMKKWHKTGLAPPLVVTPHYVQTSRDVFPLEFMVMAAGHKPVMGIDPLEGVTVEPEHLRLQLEREFKGKLANLRVRTLDSLGDKALLLDLVHESLPAFTALFQGYLQLTQGGFPHDPEQVIAKVSQSGRQVGAFKDLLDVRDKLKKPDGEELLGMIEDCIAQLAGLCDEIDELQI